MNYGFIGCGNICNAILEGISLKKNINNENIYLFNRNKQSQKECCEKFNTKSCSSLDELVDTCEVVILAVKPNIILSIINSINKNLDPGRHVIISLASGHQLKDLQAIVKNNIPIIRVMPNLNLSIAMGTSAFCANEHAKDIHKEIVISIFKPLGMLLEMQEKDFSIFTAIAGSSPAFTYLYINSLAKAGLKLGLPKNHALEIAAQSVIGSANKLLKSSEHPWELIDKVCSPGGMTIEGICTLEESNFESAVIKAIENTVKKDALLKK